MSNRIKQGDWRCPRCRDNQFARNHHCRRCGHKRPARDGEWNCPNCGDLQFATRTHCRQCSTPKTASSTASSGSAPPAMRKGDWVCPSCGDVQFASRVVCRRCQTSKPAAENAAIEDACMVCCDKVKNASLLHGDDIHIVCCLDCANDLKARNQPCPLCRRPIERVLKTYQ